MILYHGSYLEISKPALIYSRSNLDFGTGFYTTLLSAVLQMIRCLIQLNCSLTD